MNTDGNWLEEWLLKERNDVLKLLDHNHKALIAVFETKYVGVAKEPTLGITASCGSQKLIEARTTSRPEKKFSAVEVEHASESEADRRFSSKKQLSESEADKRFSSKNQLSESEADRRFSSKKQLSTGPATTSTLVRAFDEIDKDRSGKVSLEEFRAALQAVGWSPVRARKMVKQIEILSKGTGALLTGEIDRGDWMRLVCGELVSMLDPEILELADKLDELARKEAEEGKSRRYLFMLSSFSTTRLAWDCLTALCTIYVVTLVPLWLGFGTDLLIPKNLDIASFTKVENFIDIVFLLDIALNFRTTYFTRTGIEVKCWRKVAIHYFGSWFLVDSCSSIPVSFISDAYSGVDIKSVKLVKFTRFFAILKIMRTSRVFTLMEETPVGEYIEEKITEYKLYTHMRIVKIALSLVAICHWLACAMAACGLGFIQTFIVGAKNFSDVYVPAFYWAMTTCTTVGYGDIIPTSTEERLVAMVAMCCGGSFYGIVSGTFASIIASYDKSNQDKIAKMEVVNVWLQKNKFPRPLKRKIHYFFKSTCSATETCTKDEVSIIQELTSPLLTEVAQLLLPEEVRAQAIFECVPTFVLGFLLSILNVVSFKAEDVIMREGDYGDAMYIVKQGHCEKQIPTNLNNADASSVIKLQLYTSESFGEEFVLGLEESCQYTVLAIKHSHFYCILKQLFQVGMEQYPEHLGTMRHSFQSTAADEASAGDSDHSNVREV